METHSFGQSFEQITWNSPESLHFHNILTCELDEIKEFYALNRIHQ